MKKQLLFLFAALLPMLASAEKVEIDGIWYNLDAGTKQAEVTYKGDSYSSYWDEYSGSITLPATVTYEGVNYSVTSIGVEAFCGCSLTSITLPEGVTSIGDHAFSGCNSLTAITLPESVTSIGEYAFWYCSSLTAINIPESVTSIGDQAFYECNRLTSITLPEGVTSIGEYAFSYCRSLTSITIPEGSQLTSIGDDAFRSCSSLTAITLPEGVTSIGEWAFSHCSSLTAITIPESVTSIGSGAFCGCSSLTAITIPEGVTSIGSGAFYGCSSLTAITIPEGVTSIYSETFSGCSSLTAINIPEGVTSIGSWAFCDCSSLTTITLPEGVTSIGGRAFSGCSSLTAITIPEGVTSIGDGAFSGCSSLTDIAIPEGVTSIGEEAFYECSSLTAITLPEGVTSIGRHAFGDCSSLTDVYCYAEEVPTTRINPFNGSNFENATLHVPANALNAYKTTYPWSSFGKFETIETLVEGITLSQSSATLTEGETLSLTATVTPDDATNKAVTWSSSNTSVATVDANGKVTAKAAGTATITATANDGSGVKASCKVTVEKKVILVSQIILSQTSAILTEGETLTLTATVTPDNADNTTISWSSSNEDIAMVSSKGKVVAMRVGTATITATANDGSGAKASCVVTVEKKVVAVSSITLSQSSATLTEGETLSLTATVTPDDATDKGITWSSSNTSVATVDANGKVTAIAPGTATITATANDGSGVKATCEVTVVAAEYTITYYVDGEIYHQETLTRGTAIVPIEAPEKEGHTFSGWSEVPATMPAEDITITGTFTVNTYTVTFTIDGVVIASSTQEYGSAITVPSAPTREGYTFSGWGEVPTTMPASDVTYDATYIPNTYKVYYFVGDRLVHVAEVAYGKVIPEYIYEPTTEGDVFMGWIGDTYDTMPAHDVTYTANIANGIENSEINTLNSEFIYDLMGRKVTDTENLTGGIYIIGGKKVIIK